MLSGLTGLSEVTALVGVVLLSSCGARHQDCVVGQSDSPGPTLTSTNTCTHAHAPPPPPSNTFAASSHHVVGGVRVVAGCLPTLEQLTSPLPPTPLQDIEFQCLKCLIRACVAAKFLFLPAPHCIPSQEQSERQNTHTHSKCD